MSFLLYFRRSGFALTIFLAAVFCISAVISGNAQFPETEQNLGAIDPLLFNLRYQPHNIKLSPEERSAGNILIDNSDRTSPTAGELDTSLNAAIDSFPGYVRSSARQEDGKILVGGYFKTINGVQYKSIVRLNTDNSIDQTFNADINGTVFAIAVQTDGKIVIGGSFTLVNGAGQNRIARLNADGSLDTTFNIGLGADNVVYDIAVQPDGKILLGGSFIGVDKSQSPYIARLNTNGSVDSTFASPILPSPSPVVPGIVYSIALQADGKIVLGGLIVTNPNTIPFTTTPVTRLNSDGSFDSSFKPGTINSNLYKVVVQPDGKLLIGGFFSTINGNNRRYLARLNADGSLDASFNPGSEAGAPVYTIHLKSDGKILFGSLIFPLSGVAKQLNPDGSLDKNFKPNEVVTGTIYTIISTSGGKIFTGGSFSAQPGGTPNTALLFNPDGSPDTSFSFNSTALGGVRAIAVQPDGKIIIAGNFNRVNGVGKNRLARLNSDGSIDNTFNATSLSAPQITAMILQPDGKILVGGTNITVGTNTSYSLVRLNSDGTADSSFTQADLPGNRTAVAIALQADGKILFSYVNTSLVAGVINGGVSRLNSNGSLDSSFVSSVNVPFEAIVVQPDGKILVAGPFSFGYVNSGSPTGDIYYGVIRLNSDGSHDKSFRAGLFSEEGRFTGVYALALQPDGNILVGGSLFTESEAAPFGVMRLGPTGAVDPTFEKNKISSSSEFARVEDLQLLPNGKILVGGLFNNLGTAVRSNIARLNANGSVDTAFNAGTNYAVYDIDLQADGKALIGGDFDTVNNIARTSLARLLNEETAPRRSPFDFDGDGKTDYSIYRPSAGEWWYLRSGDGGNRAFQFGSSTDRIVPADYTGDGKTDVAFFRPSTGEWFVLRSEDSSFYSAPFGAAGDIPAPADYDGDGKADLAVFRPSEANWYINRSSGGFTIVQFGASGDVPVPADYDGDGKADLAVYRPTAGEWWFLRSSDGGNRAFQFGNSTDKPVPGDYTGDGKADVAFWRPASGEWFVLRSEDFSFFAFPFGSNGDMPVPGDYDGDGKLDAAVFRPSVATWFVQRSAAGTEILQFGTNGDTPVPSAFLP